MPRKLLLALVALALAAAAQAGTMKHPGGFSFWVPDGWKSKTEGTVVEVTDPADEVLLVLYTPETIKELKGALKQLDKELAKWVTNIKVGEPEEGKEDGVDYLTVEGTGKVKGETVALEVGVFHSEDDMLMVLAAVDAAAAAKHEATIEKVLDSIGGD